MCSKYVSRVSEFVSKYNAVFVKVNLLGAFLMISWLCHGTLFCWLPWLLKNPGDRGFSAGSPRETNGELVPVPLVF